MSKEDLEEFWKRREAAAVDVITLKLQGKQAGEEASRRLKEMDAWLGSKDKLALACVRFASGIIGTLLSTLPTEAHIGAALTVETDPGFTLSKLIYDWVKKFFDDIEKKLSEAPPQERKEETPP